METLLLLPFSGKKELIILLETGYKSFFKTKRHIYTIILKRETSGRLSHLFAVRKGQKTRKRRQLGRFFYREMFKQTRVFCASYYMSRLGERNKRVSRAQRPEEFH
jgi:hypothetical protein